MRLNDPLVTEIMFNNRVFHINLAFDNVLDIFDVLNDNNYEMVEKIDLICSLLIDYEIVEEEINKKIVLKHLKPKMTLDEMIEFYSKVRDEHIVVKDETFIERDVMGEPMPLQKNQIMDIELDAKFIFASFFTMGINLFEQQGKLSWGEFQALLEALPDDSIMSKIIRIREWEPQKGDSTERISEMRKLQKKYALPNSKVGEDDV